MSSTARTDGASTAAAEQHGVAEVVVEVVVERRPASPWWRREPWSDVLVPIVGSRILVGVLVVVTSWIGAGRFTLGAFHQWDGEWYLRIAAEWYGPPPVEGVQTAWPFFPLLPALVRVVSAVGVPAKAALFLVANGAFVAAVFGVRACVRLLATRRGVDGAAAGRWAVWVTCLAPYSLVFSMGYPSSIMLAGTAWAFVFAAKGRVWPAALCVLAVTSVRPNGFVVGVAIVAYLLLDAGRRTWFRSAALTVAPSVVFVAAWAWFNWERTGHPITFLTSKEAWGEVTVLDVPRDLARLALPHLAVFAAAVVFLVVARRLVPRSWLVLAALYLTPSLLLGTVGLGRYSTECLAVVGAAGIVLSTWPRRRAVATLAVSTLGLGAMCTFGLYYGYLV